MNRTWLRPLDALSAFDYPPEFLRQRRACLTWSAVAATLALYLGPVFDSGPAETLYERWGWLPATDVYDGGAWALLSAPFVHRNLFHLAFDLGWLVALGRPLELALGWWRWLLLFVVATTVSGAAGLFFGRELATGSSGVGYALLGFMGILRPVHPVFRLAIGPTVLWILLFWLVGGSLLSLTGMLDVDNAVHYSGLLFGLALGASVALRRYRTPIAIALGLIASGAVASVFWAPWSYHWTSTRARAAFHQQDYPEAIRWYERSQQLGQDPEWCRQNIDLMRQLLKRPAATTNTSANANNNANPAPNPPPQGRSTTR